ncbi:hypothetical protein BJ165DRAFT_1598798 [Panaeolus papilionaceus]|nr:hypothetical protein BJ165DRAFT_1598798 [Panaeolus papilionaceus]
MSNMRKKYQGLKTNGPLSVVPVTPEGIKGQILYVFLLMGPTGSGKSTFIELLSPDQKLDISKDSLESVTQEVVCYQVVNLMWGSCNVLLVDTPGFLDAKMSESRITKMITVTLDGLNQSAAFVYVHILYFQPITDIRMGGSKRNAVKLLRAFAESFRADGITVVATMWNHISSSKKMEDVNHQLSDLENEIFVGSDQLGIDVMKFEFSSHSALSILDNFHSGWVHNEDKLQKMDPQYQSLIHTNLLGRISNICQQLLTLAEDKQSATAPGREDLLLLEVVLRDEKVGLAALQSFLDDLVAIGPNGLVALESLLDVQYNANPTACSLPWPWTTLPPNTSSPVPKDLVVLDQTSLPFTSPIPSTIQNQTQEPSLSNVLYASPDSQPIASTSQLPQSHPHSPPSPSPSNRSFSARLKGVVSPLKKLFKK